MTKELQDQVWATLPKEFKEEVKAEWLRALSRSDQESELIKRIFGHHNLTSGAESQPETQNKAKESETAFASDAQNNDDMEDKELNLCEILKGHEGLQIFSLIEGEVAIRYISLNRDGTSIQLGYYYRANGTFSGGDGTLCLLYPSRKAYLKYPLDARKAWQEWIDGQKPKRWTPQIGETIYWVKANLTVSQDRFNDYETQRKRRAAGNEFRTGKEAHRAAEALKQCLAKFNEENQQ